MLGSLTADQRSSGLDAAFCHAGDDLCDLLGHVLAAGDVVQEEQGLCAAADHIVDAHGNAVDAHGVMLVQLEGDLELGADAVGTADQHRLLHAGKVGGEETAEAAHVGADAGGHGFCDVFFHQRHRAVPGGDIHAGGGITVRFRLGIHGGFIPFGATFAVFSDFMRPAIRLAALMKQGSIFVFTHDSIALGEDGPTHQPIEQVLTLRSIPNNNVIRPCDARETYGAWRLAMVSEETPTCLILSRQGLPLIASSKYDLSRGAYVISKKENAVASVMATGSEVKLALDAQTLLANEGINVDVVSAPCLEIFDAQDESYRKSVLPYGRENTIAVEMLCGLGWYKYANTVMSLDTFGASAPAKDVIKNFNFTAERLVEVVKGALK